MGKISTIQHLSPAATSSTTGYSAPHSRLHTSNVRHTAGDTGQNTVSIISYILFSQVSSSGPYSASMGESGHQEPTPHTTCNGRTYSGHVAHPTLHH